MWIQNVNTTDSARKTSKDTQNTAIHDLESYQKLYRNQNVDVKSGLLLGSRKILLLFH